MLYVMPTPFFCSSISQTRESCANVTLPNNPFAFFSIFFADPLYSQAVYYDPLADLVPPPSSSSSPVDMQAYTIFCLFLFIKSKRGRYSSAPWSYFHTGEYIIMIKRIKKYKGVLFSEKKGLPISWKI